MVVVSCCTEIKTKQSKQNMWCTRKFKYVLVFLVLSLQNFGYNEEETYKITTAYLSFDFAPDSYTDLDDDTKSHVNF